MEGESVLSVFVRGAISLPDRGALALRDLGVSVGVSCAKPDRSAVLPELLWPGTEHSHVLCAGYFGLNPVCKVRCLCSVTVQLALLPAVASLWPRLQLTVGETAHVTSTGALLGLSPRCEIGQHTYKARVQAVGATPTGRRPCASSGSRASCWSLR